MMTPEQHAMDAHDPKPIMHDAIESLIGVNAGFSTYKENGEVLVNWLEADKVENPPSKTKIKNRLTQLQIDWEVRVWQRERRFAYNSVTVGEQLGMQHEDAMNGTTTWVDWVNDIKEKFPKPI